MHVDFADDGKADQRSVRLQLLFDRRDRRRGGDFGVGEIEAERCIEHQRQLLVLERGGHADARRQVEYESNEGRLDRSPHPHRRALLHFGRGLLLPQQTLRFAGAFGEFPDDLLRQAWRRAAPPFRHQIDESALARIHGVDGDLARQREADRHAVRIAASRADIVRHRRRQLIDRNLHRLAEADDQHRSGDADVGIDVFRQLEHQPGIAASGRERRLAPDRLLSTRRPARNQRQQQAAGYQRRDRRSPDGCDDDPHRAHLGRPAVMTLVPIGPACATPVPPIDSLRGVSEPPH
jgi:hypothetical protein